MGYAMIVIEVIVSIVLPVGLYLWVSKQSKKQLSSDSDATSHVPDILFMLKRWWAMWCIAKKDPDVRKSYRNYQISSIIADHVKSLENPKILTNEDSCNSVSFYAADQKGNSLFVKFSRRRQRATELSLQLSLPDGRLFVLPDYPNTVVIDNVSQGWSAGGLRIESLEPQQRWRITYNGLLKDLSKKDAAETEEFEHIRLNCIFIASCGPIEWPADWSLHLHADALAREPWRSPEWMNKINQIDYTGFDQWGSIVGQVTFKDSSNDTLYLRGVSQRRWGKHESNEFHKCVTLFGVTTKGTMYYIGASNPKRAFSHIQFGHIREPRGAICKIDQTNLRLSDFAEQKDGVRREHRVQFTAGGRKYNTVLKFTTESVLYSGQPWNWANRINNFTVELNGDKGVGLLQLWHPCDKVYEGKVRNARVQCLLQPNTCIQKDDYVLFFDDRKCQNENIVGGKAFSLSLLSSIKDSDFVVPRGFCVTAFALDLQLQSHKELQKVIDDIEKISTGNINADLKTYCENAVSIIQSTPVVEPVKEAIAKAMKELEATEIACENDESKRYAVRSSAVGEDSEETSAAGQNSTYLGIKDTENIVKSVAMCWASLFTYQSVEYRRQNGLPVKASMGVCVQKMINAEAAGVMFTRHPTTGDPTSIIITANYGLGETVVSATVEPDTFTVHRNVDDTLRIESCVVGKKTEKISMSNKGVSTIKLNEAEAQRACISEETALRLAKIGVDLEYAFGAPRDVEWAVVNGTIYMLQARPITTLNAWTDFELIHELDSGVPNDTDIMTFANVGEVLPKPLSPLAISTSVRLFNVSIALKMKEFDVTYLHMVGMRCAINYFSTLMSAVGKEISMTNKVTDVAVCGRVILTPEMFKTAQERNGVTTGFKQFYMLYDMLKEAWLNSSKEREARELHKNCVLNIDRFHTAYSLYNEITKKWHNYFNISQCHAFTSRVSIVYQMFAMGILTKGSNDFMPDHFSDIAILLSSCSNVIGIEILTRLREIVQCIKKNDKAEEFSKLDPTKAIDWLILNCPNAAKLLQDFLKEHGHRAIQEMDVISEPWSLKPEQLIVTLQMMAVSFEETADTKEMTVEETVAALKTPKSSFDRWLLKKIVPFCRKAVTYREMTKSTLSSNMHNLRLAYRKLGKLMVMEGLLPKEDLIFFFTHQEIEQMLSNKSRNSILIRKAVRRSKLYHQVDKLKYPEFCSGMPVPVKTMFDGISRDDCKKIQGTSVCGGSVLGRACVVKNFSETKNIQHGDILVTHSTDIAWSPYFPLLSGIVTELGGLISHGAVVAREYGLPCIVGASGATQIFETGDTVLLTADNGTLQLVQNT